MLVAPVRVDPQGLLGPTPRQVRGRLWRRTSRGRFLPVTVDASLVEQRIVEAAAVLPRYGGVTGWAQLRWAGGRWFSGLEPDGRTPRPVPVVTYSRDIRPQPGIHVSQEHVEPGDLVVHDGLRTTTSLRSVLYEMRHARTLAQAVVCVDMAGYDDLVSLAELDAFIARHVGWPGIRRARAALDLADENSWSPRESLMRLLWIEAGLPKPLTNVPLFDLQGRHLGTPDLLDVGLGLMGEYDGEVHLDGGRRHHDVVRGEGLRSAGLEVVTMMAADAADPFAMVDRIRSAARRARRTPLDDRGWTIERPSWWIDTETVAQRRALTTDQRERLLRHRRL